jgi:hypothetical protein
VDLIPGAQTQNVEKMWDDSMKKTNYVVELLEISLNPI